MTPEDALTILLSKLDECGIRYMITGSFASNIHGLPRATQDADVIIEAQQKTLERLLETLGSGFYWSLDAATEALAEQRMFNIVHLETGFKIDLIIRKSRPFSEVEFSRRQAVFYLGANRWFASAEDTVLAKLEWSKMSGSERQFNDALNIAKLQKNTLDRAYLEKWARDLGILDLIEKLLQEME